MAQCLCVWVRAYWFSVTSFSHFLNGCLVAILDFRFLAWFRQRNSGLLWNFSFKFHVHVLCGCRQKPNDCQLCRFQNGCLVHCYPLLWGRGILVDHWSTISSIFSGKIAIFRHCKYLPGNVWMWDAGVIKKKRTMDIICILLHFVV